VVRSMATSAELSSAVPDERVVTETVSDVEPVKSYDSEHGREDDTVIAPPKEVVAKVLSNIVSQELADPNLLRATPARVVLRNFGRILRGSAMDPDKLYQLSYTVTSIDEFWSHSWHGRVSSKVWLLLMLKNGLAACIGSTAVALLATWLSIMEFLPGWYKEVRIQVEGDRGEFRHSPWALILGSATGLLILLLWQPRGGVFVDRVCIHQGDERQKFLGVIHMGAFLKRSRKLVVVWDPSYLSRAWCIFELAAFLHSHRDSAKASLVVKPTSIAPATFLIHIGGVLLLLFEIVLPANDIVFVVRIVYMFMWNVVIFFLLRRFWRDVVIAEDQFRNFRWQDTKCHCCSKGHRSEDGSKIMCDRTILEETITQWFGSVQALEESVRTEVRELFIRQITVFPFGYWWMVGANTYVIWGQLDTFAARFHGGADRYAISVLISTVGWLLWVAPVGYLVCARLAQWMKDRRSPWCQAVVTLVTFVGGCINFAWSHLLVWGLYDVFPDPIVAGLVFLLVGFCVSATLYCLLVRSPKGARKSDSVSL